MCHLYLQASPYSGKPEKGEGPYYINSTENHVPYLFSENENGVMLQGQNVSMDHHYASITLANLLLSRIITCVGRLNHNPQGLSAELKDSWKREEFLKTWYYESENKDLCLLLHITKLQSSGRKNNLLLLTVRALKCVTKDDNKKTPNICKFYDFAKGKTDIVDQLSEYYIVRSQSNRWDLVAFYYILDTIRVDSKTLYIVSRKA